MRRCPDCPFWYTDLGDEDCPSCHYDGPDIYAPCVEDEIEMDEEYEIEGDE